jgi:hypothetical protein
MEREVARTDLPGTRLSSRRVRATRQNGELITPSRPFSLAFLLLISRRCDFEQLDGRTSRTVSKGDAMNQSQDLEAALAEAERILAEQNAELDAVFARLENLGSFPIPIDMRELAEVANCQPAPARLGSPSWIIAPRC